LWAFECKGEDIKGWWWLRGAMEDKGEEKKEREEVVEWGG
jgi:hypothetical protein